MTAKKANVRVTQTLNFEQAVGFVKAHLRADRTPYLEGQPGVGKTTVGHVIAQDKEMAFDGSVIITPTMHNALDLRGFGYTADIFDSDGKIIGKETRFAQSRVLPTKGKWLVIIDELPDCPIHEQSGFYQLLLSGQIGEYTLPKGSKVMGCGNSPEHRAAANELSTAIRGRVATAILVPDVECLKRHALRSGWSPVTISFFRNYPACVGGFDPDDFAGGCTPRDLDAVSRLELVGWPEDESVSVATAIGNLGNKWGEKYHAHRAIQIPDPEEVLKRPLKAIIPQKLEVMYAFSSAVAQRSNRDNLGNIRKYSERLEKVHEVGLMYDCLVCCPDIVETQVWNDFFENNERMI